LLSKGRTTHFESRTVANAFETREAVVTEVAVFDRKVLPAERGNEAVMKEVTVVAKELLD
jgi:hypothetical protein